MPQYNVDKAIWVKGIKQAVGSVIFLTEAQAKYWSHAVSKFEDKPAVVAAPVAKKAKRPDLTVAVTEPGAPADGAGN